MKSRSAEKGSLDPERKSIYRTKPAWYTAAAQILDPDLYVCEATMPKIKLFTLSTCSHCNRTKRFFRDNGIDMEFIDVDLLAGEERERILDEVRKLNPDCSFPTICIGDTIIIGFHEEELRKALNI